MSQARRLKSLPRQRRSIYGPFFVQDYQEVYRIFKQWTLNTPVFAWVRPFDKREDGRGAVAAMSAHYVRSVNTAKNLAKAEADLKNLNLQELA